MRDSNGQEMVDKNNDIDVTLTPGRNWYKRSFDIKPTAATGYYDVMWGFHKAHLAGMYGNSGWLENRLKVVTFGELLDDLAKAEEELYQSSISLVNHYDRVMVCDFVHYSIVFDSDLGTETAALVIQMGVPIPVVYAIVEGIMAVKMVYPEAEAISAQNTCIKDDQKYLQTRDLLRSGFPENNPEFNLKDKECIDNINIKHQDFQSFLVDGYGVADKDRDKLALIIENEILLLNKANSELFLAKTQPIFYGDDPIGWTLVYHDKYDKTIRRVPLASRSGYKVSVVIATLGMFGACALTGPGVVACAPVLVAGSIGGYAGNRIIDAGLYEAGLSFISDEANGINTDLQNIDNYYTSLLTETENKLNLVESIPQGKIISLNGENSEVGKLTTLNVKFSNIGTKNLQAKGYFNLFYNGNYLATITTGSKNIKSGVTEDISTTIMPELAGTYVVNCYVQYDNMKSDTLSTQISVAPVTSAIVVNTNNANAKFTIIGLQSFSGDGTSWSTTEALIGTYKIIFDPIEGYDTPPSQELELTPDSTITFTGDYIQQTITYSITLNSNRADIPLIVDGKVIYHDELPKTFTWSKNSEHTIKAQTEVYKEASTKYVFVKWDDGNTDSERTITVNSDKTYNAEYKTRYYLSLKTNPENIGAVFGAGWYDVNSPAEITAPVIPGYAFTGWTVDDSKVVGNPILVSMDSSHNAVANYVSTDTSLPTVIGNTPTGSDVPVNTPITISFSEAMNKESAQSAFYTSPATIGSFSWSGNTMAYTPSSNLVSDTTYIVTVGTGATDLTGNNLQSPYSWQFTTASIEPKLCTNTIGMEFVLIPAGKFKMGSPSDEEGRFEDEGPIHQVTIGNALYMGRYEVTQQQWRAVMGDNPSCFTGDDDLPVECVSWDDVQEFIWKLNDKEGTTKYRLPSEAEWEYVCRAGTTTRYSFGDDESELGDYAWYDDNSNDKTHPVGQKKPNPWGLYDMHGNVWEWVQDCWHSNYNGALADGSAWVYSCKYDGADRVYRGGGWFGDSRGCRSAIRDDRGCGFGVRCVDLGFRILKEQ
jgi:formylglycine-generating enzyme required for sulfatase activity